MESNDFLVWSNMRENLSRFITSFVQHQRYEKKKKCKTMKLKAVEEKREELLYSCRR